MLPGQNSRSAGNGPGVDLNLVLAIDCSYSVDADEYALQMKGLALAFLNEQIISAIKNGRRGAITVSVVQWSRSDAQIIVIPWTKISTKTEAQTFAATLAATKRQMAKGATSISGVLNFSKTLFINAPQPATRQVIDIIADGTSNQGEPIETARARLIATGITINALAIHNEVSYLHHYMQNHVIGGQNAFTEKAKNYKEFTKAIRRKLLREIQGDMIS